MTMRVSCAILMLCIACFDICSLIIFSTMTDLTANSFNAESHIKLINNTFANLNIAVNDFVIAQTSDSTALNPRIARLLEINHVACQNHCLNLGCKDMEKNCSELSDISDKTQAIHLTFKASNKLTAVMENAQASASELGSSVPRLKLLSKTLWNSLEAMLVNHTRKVPSIRAVIEDNPKFELDDKTTTTTFIRKIEKHLKYLTPLKKASVNMQTTGATLDDCQFQCDIIAKLSSVGKDVVGHDFQHCM